MAQWHTRSTMADPQWHTDLLTCPDPQGHTHASNPPVSHQGTVQIHKPLATSHVPATGLAAHAGQTPCHFNQGWAICVSSTCMQLALQWKECISALGSSQAQALAEVLLSSMYPEVLLQRTPLNLDACSTHLCVSVEAGAPGTKCLRVPRLQKTFTWSCRCEAAPRCWRRFAGLRVRAAPGWQGWHSPGAGWDEP
eukprot:1158186-Pelagomonas_calceolata.AAC.9